MFGAARQNNVVAVYPGNKSKPEESRKVQRGIKIGMRCLCTYVLYVAFIKVKY
jgi:hypothetical protein